MNILLLGPQGSGKGTQARLLCEKYGFFYFESGAYLRKIAENNPELKKYLAEGKLVPDEEMTSYLAALFDEKNLYDDIIFDGFPRTLSQYNFWRNWLTQKEVSIDLVVVLEIEEEETIRRLTARRMDPTTGEIYNLITDPPPAEVDADKLVQRDDDKPDAIKVRLNLYKERTEPLISELGKDSKVVKVDGARPVEEIQTDLVGLIETFKNEHKD
ncbi:MAG: adenylate kinase family protein [Microgenomates group bacterium]